METFDLYLARGFEKLASNRYPSMRPMKFRKTFPDILLENRNEKYYEVTEGSNIVGNTFSSGVNAADFNNDGFVDLIVTQNDGPDVLLMNNGDGTFKHLDPKTPKRRGVRTDNTVAVKIDNDGYVDIISAQGMSRDYRGSYKVLKNMLPHSSKTNHITIRVGSSPSRACTALHAVVTVVANGQEMVRRVGSRGAQKAGPGSFYDIVHFGIGDAQVVDKVIVKWISGEWRARRNVTDKTKIRFGRK